MRTSENLNTEIHRSQGPGVYLTFVVMFVDTYASWHIISVIILPKSGEGN